MLTASAFVPPPPSRDLVGWDEVKVKSKVTDKLLSGKVAFEWVLDMIVILYYGFDEWKKQHVIGMAAEDKVVFSGILEEMEGEEKRDE